jgi:hypothetical protein
MASTSFLTRKPLEAPYKAVKEAVARGYLGDLNPIPWAFMTGNCVGWVAYSFLQNVSDMNSFPYQFELNHLIPLKKESLSFLCECTWLFTIHLVEFMCFKITI